MVWHCNGMALCSHDTQNSLQRADVPLRNCSLTDYQGSRRRAEVEKSGGYQWQWALVEIVNYEVDIALTGRLRRVHQQCRRYHSAISRQVADANYCCMMRAHASLLT